MPEQMMKNIKQKLGYIDDELYANIDDLVITVSRLEEITLSMYKGMEADEAIEVTTDIFKNLNSVLRAFKTGETDAEETD